MRGQPQHGSFLLLVTALSVLSTAFGAWLFWLSGARHLLVTGGAMLLITLVMQIRGRRLPSDEPARH